MAASQVAIFDFSAAQLQASHETLASRQSRYAEHDSLHNFGRIGSDLRWHSLYPAF
jgi:hypothetical protein